MVIFLASGIKPVHDSWGSTISKKPDVNHKAARLAIGSFYANLSQ
jgi:hypothetical protein